MQPPDSWQVQLIYTMQSVVLIFVMPCSCSQACYPVNVAHVGYSGCYRGGTVSWYVFAKKKCCDLVDSVKILSTLLHSLL